MTTKITQISLMVSVALGKHQIAQQLVRHHCSVRSEKQTAMAENSFDWCWCARCTKTLSKSGFQACKLFVIPHKVPRYSGSASVPSSISCMNARYEVTTVGIEMFLSAGGCLRYNINSQGLKNIEIFSLRPRPGSRLFLQDRVQDQDFYFKTKTKTKTIFMSPRRLETKTKVSRLHPWG